MTVHNRGSNGKRDSNFTNAALMLNFANANPISKLQWPKKVTVHNPGANGKSDSNCVNVAQMISFVNANSMANAVEIF